MKRNTIKSRLAAGETILNGWLHIPSTWSAEVMAHAGWDSITVDMQHGMHSLETVIQMIQVISGTDVIPLTRVNWLEPGTIMRLLDAGAYGIICPLVNTREECEAFVGACLYPPQGYRSLGPTRARVALGADYADHANEEMLVMAMVETAQALDNLDAIASVPGLDMIFVGTGDLRLTLRARYGDEGLDQRMDEALDAILAACQQHGIHAGSFAPSPENARQLIARGFRFVTVMTDSMLLGRAAQQAIQEARG